MAAPALVGDPQNTTLSAALSPLPPTPSPRAPGSAEEAPQAGALCQWCLYASATEAARARRGARARRARDSALASAQAGPDWPELRATPPPPVPGFRCRVHEAAASAENASPAPETTATAQKSASPPRLESAACFSWLSSMAQGPEESPMMPGAAFDQSARFLGNAALLA